MPALKNETITIYGDGNQIMDMIYVKDVAEILVQALINKKILSTIKFMRLVQETKQL